MKWRVSIFCPFIGFMLAAIKFCDESLKALFENWSTVKAEATYFCSLIYQSYAGQHLATVILWLPKFRKRPSIHPVRRFIPSVSSVVLFTPRHKCLSWVVATEDLVRMKWEWGKNLSNNGIAPTRRQNNSHEEATRSCQAWKCGCQWKLSTKMWFEMPSISAPILRRFSVLAA